MLSLLVVLYLMAIGHEVLAHSPDFSNIIISKTKNGQIILQINTSLTAFQQEVNYINGEGAYTSPEEFQNLVIDHFYHSFSIVINNKDTLHFKNPKVFLGHETKLVAEITGLPETVSTIRIKNTLFKDIHNNQSVVIFLLDKLPKNKFTLNKDNKHEINIALKDGKWNHQKIDNASFNLKYVIYLVIPFLIGLLFYISPLRKSS